MKIYTRTGDRGETGLLDGSRVAKDDLRVAAYGDVDELNAVLGMVRAQPPDDERLDRLLHDVQRDLFAVGAHLADPSSRVASRKAKTAVTPDQVARLEGEIDEREAELPPLKAFILSGGGPVGALLHLARTVCRRAERTVVALGRSQDVDPEIFAYLNRLSDLLFTLARYANHTAGRPEETW